MTNNTFASWTQKLSLKCNSEAYILWDGLYNDDWNNHMRPICSATQMIKAFFLRQLIPNSKHINHVFSCFASRTQNLSSLYKFEAYISCNRLYIYTTYIYVITRVFFNYCCWQFPPHLQRPVHTRLAFIHLHLPLHVVLHPQWISS